MIMLLRLLIQVRDPIFKFEIVELEIKMSDEQDAAIFQDPIFQVRDRRTELSKAKLTRKCHGLADVCPDIMLLRLLIQVRDPIFQVRDRRT